MKQVIQSYRTGELELADVPAPVAAPGSLIVRTVCSVVSVGTEKYMLDLARKSLLGKALARPDLARQVLNKVKTEGMAEAYRQAMGRLDNPVPLGYSSAGVVLDVGSGVEGFSRGDRVACAGSTYASHAEIVRIPRNMVEKIPDGVSDEEAAFVTLGGIAMHGVRLAEVTFGEKIVVLGLGLLGQLAVQILKAAGCRVFGADLDPSKVELARALGADAGGSASGIELAQLVRAFTGGAGADAVVIFAATASNDPIELAADLARERGRIVVPGLVGLDLPRKVSYEKELSYRVSRAWGPGLYDPNYEERGLDYPMAFVRWTAQRNLGEFLQMLAARQVRVGPLITHRFPLDSAVDVYTRLLAGKEHFLGVLLTYDTEPDSSAKILLDAHAPSTASGPGRTAHSALEPGRSSLGARRSGTSDSETETAARNRSGGRSRADEAPEPPRRTASTPVRIGLVGAGLFARGTLLPALKGATGARLQGVATASGVSARHVGRRYGFAFCATRAEEVIHSPEIDLVMILTRHGSHARLVAEALAAGKHVFVEKPLALNEEQLSQVIEARRGSQGTLMVGFNRRYAPTTKAVLKLMERLEGPFVVSIRVNAGLIPRESWVHDPLEGGGPLVGEACHFMDLAQALTRSLPIRVHARATVEHTATSLPASNAVMTLQMKDGSVANVIYTTSGDKSFSRERVEVFGGGATCAIENFRTVLWSQGGRTRRIGRSWSGVDRGYSEEMKVLLDSVRRDEPSPVRFEEYVATTRATFAILESLRTGQAVDVPPLERTGSDPDPQCTSSS